MIGQGFARSPGLKHDGAITALDPFRKLRRSEVAPLRRGLDEARACARTGGHWFSEVTLGAKL